MESEPTPPPAQPDTSATAPQLAPAVPETSAPSVTPAETQASPQGYSVMSNRGANEAPANEPDLPAQYPATATPQPIASTSAPAPAPASSATTAPQPPTSTPIPDPTIVDLISVSPTDPTRTRTFHAKYFLPVEHDAPLRAALDLPEAYFAPTPSELQQAFAGQVRKREQLVDAPLLTQKLRDQEEAKKSREKAGRWPQTRIRIRFADRSQLEGVFPSTDKMVHIYEFVRLAIAEEHRSKAFVLYQTPPRREFVKGAPELKGKTLMDLQFTPSSVFYIKFEEEQLNTATPPPLIPVLLSAASDLPIPPAFDPRKEQAATEGAPKPTKTQKLGFGGSSGKVTPSWLKLGKSGKK